MAHEVGHALGLIRQSYAGRRLIDASSPATAVFRGRYAALANGGPVALRSQDSHGHDGHGSHGGHDHSGSYDYGHTAAAVDSIMGYTQRASGPTAVDFGMLADIGYLVDGVNA